MDSLKQYMHNIRIPVNTDKIYKDECVFSFDTPLSSDGLYVCLNTFLGFGRDFVELHHKKTGNAVFFHTKRIARPMPQSDCEEIKPKITKLAIGVEGGFDVNSQSRQQYDDMNEIVILPQFVTIPLPNPDLPEQILQSISAIISADSASRLEELQALAGTWDGEKRIVTKHANTLIQLDNGIKIPPKGWKCDKCDKRDNLWLNLTDGIILCGRKYFDGTGGNNHASEYYNEKKYPLAVKLGTITPEGADVYSYDEDDMVDDPNLTKHLAHFGINIAKMEKTDKSMIELEIDLNQQFGEWSIIQEEGSQLVPLYGPGYTGLANLGNSCYLNSVMQVIFTIPDFQKLYFPSNHIFEASPADPPSDFTTQMAKLAYGLLSGKYSKPCNDESKEQSGIKPTMFKNFIGKGHQEFSTKRQQDVQEFFLHLINVIERNNRSNASPPPTDCFKFQVEERIECSMSKKVKYTTRTEYLLSLPVSDSVINREAVKVFEEKKKELELKGQKIDPKEVVRPIVQITSCIDTFAAPTLIEDFFSTAINGKSMAKQTTRLKTFPDYMMIHIKKFTLGDDWVPKKLDISLDVPEIIDISYLKSTGLQPGEELLPSGDTATGANAFEFNASILAQLSEMGFAVEGCKRALYNTNNGDIETTMNWIMEHMNDPDFSDPFILQSGATNVKEVNFVANPEAMAMIMSMGFTNEQALRALKATDNNTERAVDWIFSHTEDLNTDVMQTDNIQTEAQSSSATNYRDGSGKYKLVAFISHMGTSTMCGHYVCHILKENRWVIFNDNKVAVSENPPKDLAYLYLYQRIEQ
ncbi:ubiquitin carboxyl-terminal hydrolase 5-like [Oppia nitens]|uniref:ubiquitin carboxyl-terminal hydrolase 5-like n=1 Tax=Oppia nitens TaxID=1686743 RepID=UPI0023DB356F|nr:ubiquitin carboxyl-terminal hydrolase 5-like [Oppia nitens]